MQSRGEISGQIYLPHAQRRKSVARSARELLPIAREADMPAEIYHIKAAGKKNWPKDGQLLADRTRAKGGTEDHRQYVHLHRCRHWSRRCLPPWTEDGGYPALFKRLRDPATREKIEAEGTSRQRQMGKSLSRRRFARPDSAGRIQIRKTKPLTGKTLAEVAKMRGKDPMETTWI